MWITTYHRFTNRAAFLAACEAAGWPVQAGEPQLPQGVTVDMVGPLIGPASIGDGGAPIPGEVIDPRYHVNIAWHAQDMAPAFSDSQVVPATPARSYALPPPTQPAQAVPASVPAWKARAVLRDAGLLGAVTAAVEAAGGLVADAWAGATDWRRDSAFLAGLADELNLSPAQVDQLFSDADAIRS
jgi:hypothetical protein